jgi:spore cortex formation protein SpoVR/YcgB (stage V sporulation)
MLQTESLIHIDDDNADETSSQKNEADSSKNEDQAPEKSKSSGWHEFFAKDGTKTDQSLLVKFLTMKLVDPNNYSAKFLDFLKECLMFKKR